MFGGGFRVGVAVTRAEPAFLPGASPVGPAPPGAVAVAERPSRLGEVLPVARRDDAEIAADLARITEIEAALAAYRVELVGELAARRPAAPDTAAHGRSGAPPADRERDPGGPEEFFCDELALLLHCSRTAAGVLHEQA